MLSGNLAAIFTGAVISLTTSYLYPENFDFNITRSIGAAELEELMSTNEEKIEGDEGEITTASSSMKDGSTTPEDEKKGDEPIVTSAPVKSASSSFVQHHTESEREGLEKAYILAVRASIALFLILLILVSLIFFYFFSTSTLSICSKILLNANHVLYFSCV